MAGEGDKGSWELEEIRKALEDMREQPEREGGGTDVVVRRRRKGHGEIFKRSWGKPLRERINQNPLRAEIKEHPCTGKLVEEMDPNTNIHTLLLDPIIEEGMLTVHPPPIISLGQ